MNFKALALGSILTLGSLFGSIPSAEARPSQCWQGRASSLPARSCDVERVSYNGNVWWEINHGEKNVVLYDDGRAQIFWGEDAYDNNGRNWYVWKYDSDGDIRLEGNNNWTFIFRR